MNSVVRKLINGDTVVACPVYKGQMIPAYWMGIINERTLPQTFGSARDLFDYVAARRVHQARSLAR